MEPKKDFAREAQTIINNYMEKLKTRKAALIYKAYNLINHKKRVEYIRRRKVEKTLNLIIAMLAVILIVLLITAFKVEVSISS